MTHHTEAELNRLIRLSKQQLETTFDAITDPICAIDRNFIIQRINKSYAALVKQSIHAVLGKPCHLVFWGHSAPCDNCPALKTFERGRVTSGYRAVKEQGPDVRHYEISTYPVLDSDATVVNAIEYIRDTTDSHSLNEQLIRSEKLAGIGVMTAGIAHEMNNPLSGIAGIAANMLAMPAKYGLNEKGTERMQMVLESSQRATTIMQDLLNLSRKRTQQVRDTDLNSLLQKTVDAIHIKGIQCLHKEYALDPVLPLIPCDPSRIEQVLINLISNAVQSIEQKRMLMAEEHRPYNGTVWFSTRRYGKNIRLSISDNGCGIPPALHRKIFDPFFTTREPGQGTGLGLSICQKIIEEHQWRLSLESQNDRTVFIITAPLLTN